MGSCTRRHFLLSICVLQLLSIIERQVMDFLGYMWAPILANFFHIIFVIFGFFGAYQFRPKYILTYSIWNFIWIGWNTFLICFYLNVGILDRKSDILNLGTGSFSWFEANGFGCKPIYPTNITEGDLFRPIRPERVEDCLLDYFIVEVIHSGFQCFLAVLGIIAAITVGRIFIDEDDDRLSRGKSSKKFKSKHGQSLYSIEFSPPVDTIRGRPDDLLDYQDNIIEGPPLSPKPMTPRRVKRRSVMTRGTTNRQSTNSRRSHHSNNRNSVRSSRRKVHQNPVTKLMEQQQQQQHHHHHQHQQQQQQQQQQQNTKPYPTFAHKENPALTASNLKSLNSDMVPATSVNNFNQPPSSNYHQQQQSMNPDPIYYNMSSNISLMQQTSWNSSNSPSQGHYNPTYQHSTPNLSQSTEQIDDLYNNRPPSVRSSYSNFHGARPLSSYNPTPVVENVFSGLAGGGGQQQQKQSAQSQAQAIPQVPQRRGASRESVRSMAFLNSGPPAYNLNYHTPPDSETTM